MEVEVVRRAIQKANQAGIPVIIVNQLEPIEGLRLPATSVLTTRRQGRFRPTQWWTIWADLASWAEARR